MSFAVQIDDDVIETASNALAPNRTFRLTVTDKWTIDKYLLQRHFDFKAVTVADTQAAIRTLAANRYELWGTYGDPADFPHHP